MNAKKQREKNRRRANKLASEAWEAAEDQRFDLAVRIIRRPVDLNPANPMLWHDQGSLLVMLGEIGMAAESFQAAIRLAPEFADAYADLAAIHARQGKIEQAVTLQREAVRHAQDLDRYQKILASYEALLAAGCGYNLPSGSDVQRRSVDDRIECAPSDAFPDLAASIGKRDCRRLTAS